MSINLVQFQQGLSMSEFMQRYGTEAQAYRALYRARWPQGFRCPACAGRARSRFRRGGQVYYQCRACRQQTTLTSGTATKLPLRSAINDVRWALQHAGRAPGVVLPTVIRLRFI